MIYRTLIIFALSVFAGGWASAQQSDDPLRIKNKLTADQQARLREMQSPKWISSASSQQPLLTVGNLGLWPIFDSIDSPISQLNSKVYFIQQLTPDSNSITHSSSGVVCGGFSSTNAELVALRRRMGTPPNRFFSPI